MKPILTRYDPAPNEGGSSFATARMSVSTVLDLMRRGGITHDGHHGRTVDSAHIQGMADDLTDLEKPLPFFGVTPVVLHVPDTCHCASFIPSITLIDGHHRVTAWDVALRRHPPHHPASRRLSEAEVTVAFVVGEPMPPWATMDRGKPATTDTT